MQNKKMALIGISMILGATGILSSTGLSQNIPGQIISRDSNGNLKELTLEQLAAIEVTTVSKEPEQVRKTSAAVFVITHEDIRRSGATTVPEILRLAPGVEVSRIDSGHWSVGIRGFQGQFSRAVLVLMDGRSLYTPLFAGVFWDIQDTLFEDIERIEIIRGPGATIWGANAFEGVINIITKHSKDSHGTLASVGGGNVDQITGAIRQGGVHGQGLDYRAYGKIFSRGPQFHANQKQFDDWRMGQFGFRTDWNSSSRGEFTVQGDIYRGEVGEEVDIAFFTPPSQTTLYGNDKVSGGNLRGRWSDRIGRFGDVQVQTYFDRTSRIAPHFRETRNTFDFDFIHHFSVPLRQEISWGLGSRWSPARFEPSVPSLDLTPRDMTSSQYSGFVQDEIRLVPERLSFVLGAKLEHNNYTGLEVQPSGRLLWTPDSRQTFWAAATRAVRTPSRLDRDFVLKGFLLASPMFYLEIAGSPNFNSERLLGYEAGYRRLITSNFHIDVSAYHNQYYGLASLSSAVMSAQSTPVPYTQLGFHYVNGVRGTTDGYEIVPGWNPLTWLELKGSYSHLQMNLKNEPGNADASTVASLEGSSPRHRGIVQAHLKLPANFELDQTYRYVSALPAQKVSAYMTADARVGWQFSDGLKFSVVGQNLFQPQHIEFGHNNQQMVGTVRSAYAKVTWTR